MKWQQILAIAFKYTDDHGGGGGGGDYDQLTNRPVLNGTTISGNKTSGDYNLYNKVEVQNLLEQKQDKLVQETQGAPTDEDLVSHVTTAGNNTVRTFGNIWKWIVSKATTTLYERDDQIPTSKAVVQELGTKVDKKTTGGKSVYGHNGSLQGEYAIADTLEESTPPTDIPSVALIQAEEQKFVKRETAGGTKLYGHNGDVEKSWAVVPNAWGTSTDDQILTAKGAYLQNFYVNATRFQEDVTFTDLDDMLTKMELTGSAPMYKMGYTNKWNTLPTSDRPFNMAAVYVEVLRRDSNTFILRVTDWVGDRVIERGKTNGTWGDWKDFSPTKVVTDNSAFVYQTGTTQGLSNFRDENPNTKRQIIRTGKQASISFCCKATAAANAGSWCTIGQIPIGYRPARGTSIVAHVYNGTSNEAAGGYIDTNGSVVVWANARVDTNNWQCRVNDTYEVAY